MTQLLTIAVATCTWALDVDAEWRVVVSDASSETLQVHTIIEPWALPETGDLVLVFNDTQPEFRSRIHSIVVTQDGKEIAIEEDLRKRRVQFRCRTIDRNKALSLVYTMNPEFYPPGSNPDSRRDTRAILDEEGGILRTRTVFPSLNVRATHHSVSFELPDGWNALTPWEKSSEKSFLLNSRQYAATDYLAVGPLTHERISVDEMEIRVGVFPGANVPPSRVGDVLRLLRRDFGPFPNEKKSSRCVTIVRPGFIHGGSAGNTSTVQNTHVVTLVHELFHWWNRGSRGKPETRWYGEGVTSYIGIRYAQEAGLINAERAEMYFADLNGEMRFLEQEGPIALSASGEKAATDSRMSRLNYSKGALVMWSLQEQAQLTGNDVIPAIRRIAQEAPTGFTNEFVFTVLEEELGQEIANSARNTVSNSVRLPHLPFGPATGDSGIARFLPDRSDDK